MLRSLRILLAVLVLAPIACDAPPDDDGGATTDEETDDDGDDADDDDGDDTGEAVDPTPVPFNPPLRKECHATGARIGHCDP